jgi:hypothetical protein
METGTDDSARRNILFCGLARFLIFSRKSSLYSDQDDESLELQIPGQTAQEELHAQYNQWTKKKLIETSWMLIALAI